MNIQKYVFNHTFNSKFVFCVQSKGGYLSIRVNKVKCVM